MIAIRTLTSSMSGSFQRMFQSLARGDRHSDVGRRYLGLLLEEVSIPCSGWSPFGHRLGLARHWRGAGFNPLLGMIAVRTRPGDQVEDDGRMFQSLARDDRRSDYATLSGSLSSAGFQSLARDDRR